MKTNVAFRLDADLTKWLKQASDITGQSQAAILEDALRDWQPKIAGEVEKRVKKLRGLVPAQN